MTLKGGSRAWTAGKLGEAAQTHLGQAGHSIPIWAALVGIFRWKNCPGEEGHDGGSIGPNFGIILLTVPFHSYNYHRELFPLHFVFFLLILP